MVDARASVIFALSAAAALTAAPCAAAGRATNQMPVSVTIPSGCTVATQPLDFGTVTVTSLPVDSTSTISLRCAPGTAYSIALDNGVNANGVQRRMYSGPVGAALLRYINYNIYRDSTRLLPWTAQAGQMVSGIAPLNGRVDVTVYGRLPINLVMPVGYRDTVTVTVSF